jgi:hypothetical protein
MSFRRFFTFAATIAFAAGFSAQMAFAQDEECSVPMADWQPREAVRKMAKDKGWDVARVKIDDGCYEIFARDSKGVRFEATVNPSTLEIVQIEFDHDHEAEDGEADHHREDHKSGKKLDED